MAERAAKKRVPRRPASEATQAGKRRTSRKAPLDRERIERTALELVEKEGLGEFSMRKLGAALGVEAMSLYHHFPSKAHLFDALLDRLIAETTEVCGTERPWRERVRLFCIAYRDLGRRHPEFSRYMILHRMNTRGGLAWLEAVVSMFAAAGDVEIAARAFRCVGYYLMGTVLDETAGYARGPSAAEPVPPAEQNEIAPTVMRLGPYFQPEHWDRTFLVGLDLLLDGFERKLAAESK